MNTKQSWRVWKIWIGAGLALLVMADVALAAVLWQAGREGPQSLEAQRDRLATQGKLLKADVERGEKIRNSLPEIGKDCDKFYNEAFLDSRTGYSAISEDLGDLAAQSGLKSSGLVFTRKELKERGVTEITIKTGVQGDYPSLIKFINGLERSKNFYLLDDLRLESSTTGGIRLNLSLRTFFRT
ncbi:MAG TPA: GspMb/PilO family protein [Candidatus Sulfotelmatobacter sp.]|nr:GspMb/PilO family protein [Candidatus Sulfotelmatobacter sp.]